MHKLPPEKAPAKPAATAPPQPPAPLGVYVHFPWCIAKCPYCDFLSVPMPAQEIPSERYADAVIAELELRRHTLGEVELQSVFFGGGTPSLWQPSELGRVLSAITKALPADDELEITVECNPSSLTAERARQLADVGVNRLSVGVQGLSDQRLRFLGRWHDASEGMRCLKGALGCGVSRVSADLIYGVAGQSPREAASEAGELADLGLTHLSAYALTIEPQTRFGALARKGKLPLASDDGVAEACFAVASALESRGFEHYEISNYARDGHVARHNLGYWRGQDYLGLGCGAWGTLTDASGERYRYRNRPQTEAYLKAALAAPGGGMGPALTSERELLDADTQLTEALLLGLRLSQGLDAEAAAYRVGAQLWTRERCRAVERLTERGQLERHGSWLRIPRSARWLSDGIIRQIA